MFGKEKLGINKLMGAPLYNVAQDYLLGLYCLHMFIKIGG